MRTVFRFVCLENNLAQPDLASSYNFFICEIFMKTCDVWGDLSSDSTSEQYPTVAVCDDCFSVFQNDGEQILCSYPYDSGFGDTCHFCGKTEEEESLEEERDTVDDIYGDDDPEQNRESALDDYLKKDY